jgi:adenylate cyclase
MSRYLSAENERRRVRNAFNLYMSPALVSELAKNPDTLKLGGETKNLTILFCDIRGFTRISEQMNAQDLINLMNDFLTPMTNIILNHKGTIDKYMGDCIMAFWNAPLDDPEHAKNACLSSLEMVDALKELNEKHKQESLEKNLKYIPLGIGIGLNTGYCCVGNMGSEKRFDYSVLGDDVNLASRLEGQSKYYGVEIVIGDNTLREITGFATLELDLIKVKGKTEPVKIYTILYEENLVNDEIYIKFKNEFDIMLAQYRSGNWDEALQSIQNCRELAEEKPILNKTVLFELYERRIDDYKKSPPPDDWAGIYIALNK